MVKLFFCLFVYIGITTNVFSHNADSIVNIKGYYVTRLIKDEISFYYDQKINRINGESYSTSIDYSTVSFFVPMSINNGAVNHINDLVNIIPYENNLYKDSIYYLPLSKQSENYIKKALNLDIVLSKEICIFSEYGRISPYYINTNDDKYLYKCMFIDGDAMKITILNTEEKRFPFHLDIYSVNRKSQSIDLFFIVKVNTYSTIVDTEGLKEWVPYIDIK